MDKWLIEDVARLDAFQTTLTEEQKQKLASIHWEGIILMVRDSD